MRDNKVDFVKGVLMYCVIMGYFASALLFGGRDGLGI